MMDDLQQAYTAYQQAVYYLRDPKVAFPTRCPPNLPSHPLTKLSFYHLRTPSYGTASVSSTTDTALSSSPRRPSRR